MRKNTKVNSMVIIYLLSIGLITLGLIAGAYLTAGPTGMRTDGLRMVATVTAEDGSEVAPDYHADPIVKVIYDSPEEDPSWAWTYLLDQGYQGQDDGVEALYVPRSVLEQACFSDPDPAMSSPECDIL